MLIHIGTQCIFQLTFCRFQAVQTIFYHKIITSDYFFLKLGNHFNSFRKKSVLTSKTPRGGCRSPVKMSGRRIGRITASVITDLACSNPAILLHSKNYRKNNNNFQILACFFFRYSPTRSHRSIISFEIFSIILASTFLRRG